MGILEIFWQLVGFCLPALVLAPVMALIGRWLGPGRGGALSALWRQAGVNAAVGLAVLLAGLVLTGHDGRMVTYAALVLALATAQAVMSRAWRA